MHTIQITQNGANMVLKCRTYVDNTEINIVSSRYLDCQFYFFFFHYFSRSYMGQKQKNHIQGVLLTGTPPKSSKYKKVNLG